MSASGERRAAFRAQALPARIASGAALGVLSVLAVWRGGALFDLILGLALAVALLEFLRMARAAGHPVPVGITLALGGLCLVHTFGVAVPGFPVAAALLVVAAFLASLRAPIAGRVVGLALAGLGLAYVLGFGLALHDLRAGGTGRALVLAVLLATWASDTVAFFVGLRWGRRRLAPAVSPGKSVEGLLAGGVAAILVGGVSLPALAPYLGPGSGLLVGLVVAGAAPLGDLFESLLKRSFETKDSSQLIPGHGGVLDRIDSLLASGAAVWVLARFLAP